MEYLHSEIGKILGLDRKYKVIIIGAGNLGQALANYTDFARRGFQIVAIFDIDPKIIGTKIRDIEVQPLEQMEEYIKDNDIDIAALTVPKTSAPLLAADLVSWGIEYGTCPNRLTFAQ